MESEQAAVAVICNMERKLHKLLQYCDAVMKISVKGERKGEK